MISCKFGQICATGNALVRLIVGRNFILNFPAKIWSGMCKALLCGDDSSHSQSQSGKRLLLASRGYPIRSPLYHGSCIDPIHLSHTLDLTPDLPFPITQLSIPLLIKDASSIDATSSKSSMKHPLKNCWESAFHSWYRRNSSHKIYCMCRNFGYTL